MSIIAGTAAVVGVAIPLVRAISGIINKDSGLSVASTGEWSRVADNQLTQDYKNGNKHPVGTIISNPTSPSISPK